MSTYKVGAGIHYIRLSVDISTIGLAASRAVLVSGDSSYISVGHSTNATGDILRRDVGMADWLRNKKLRILTKIDLIGSEEENKAEAEKIAAVYMIENGEEGDKTFDDPLKKVASDFSSVILFKEILFEQ